MYKQITIKTLFQQGKKKTAIAEDMKCHRNTVRNIIKRDAPKETQVREKNSQYNQYKQIIEPWYKKDKLSYLRIYKKLQEEYKATGSYDALRRYIQKEFPKPVEAFGVQQTAPGEEAELDFGYLGMLEFIMLAGVCAIFGFMCGALGNAARRSGLWVGAGSGGCIGMGYYELPLGNRIDLWAVFCLFGLGSILGLLIAWRHRPNNLQRGLRMVPLRPSSDLCTNSFA